MDKAKYEARGKISPDSRDPYCILPFVSYRLQAIGEVLAGHSGEPPLSRKAIYGLSELIEECAAQIHEVFCQLEDQDLGKKSS